MYIIIFIIIIVQKVHYEHTIHIHYNCEHAP